MDWMPALRRVPYGRGDRFRGKGTQGHAKRDPAARNPKGPAITLHFPFRDAESERRNGDALAMSLLHGSDLADDEAGVDAAEGKGI